MEVDGGLGINIPASGGNKCMVLYLCNISRSCLHMYHSLGKFSVLNNFRFCMPLTKKSSESINIVITKMKIIPI